MGVSLGVAGPRDRLMVLAAAVLFSTGGAAVKACSLNGWQIASFRSGFAALALFALLPAARRRWTRLTWAVGLAYAGTMVLYVVANKMTTAANTIFLQDTAPLYVLLLSPLLLGEPGRRRDLLFMLILAAGMSLFFVGAQTATATAPRPVLGNVVALGAGVCWALTLMGLRRLGRSGQGDGASAAVACGNVIACLAVLPLALPIGPSTASDWASIAFLGLFQIALAYVFLTRGMRRVPALEASLLLLVEPVLNPIWAFFAHREVPTSWAMLGGAIVLGATTLKAILDDRSPSISPRQRHSPPQPGAVEVNTLEAKISRREDD
ncbi:MAG: EamA/RhaT family transporter [Acidobacteria bacterium]|nr:MAG: EamA/RhaT family transporter [Acidobacteriota bacterium]